MKYETFKRLPTAEIAKVVRREGDKVCVFPINGTRRWFMLEHDAAALNSAESYLEKMIQAYTDIFDLVFSHGIHTILTPSFGIDLMERGEAYMQMAAKGFAQLATHPLFLKFYDEYGVRVRFYGEYRRIFAGTPYAPLIETFDYLMDKTAQNDKHRLFFGLFANEATCYVAEMAIDFFQEQQRPPSREEIITAYYGEYIEAVDIFIGFDKFSVFDMPLLANGHEDIYFTIAPSPYTSTEQIRAILYDHLYARKAEADYGQLSAVELRQLQQFYHQHRHKAQGLGRVYKGIWYPTRQVSSALGEEI